MRLDDVDRIVAERPALAELGPIRNWPEHLHVTSLSGPEAVFATVEPSAVLGWFYPPVGRDGAAVAATDTGRSTGVFDE